MEAQQTQDVYLETISKFCFLKYKKQNHKSRFDNAEHIYLFFILFAFIKNLKIMLNIENRKK